MHPPSAYFIQAIQFVQASDGTIDHLEGVQAICSRCGLPSNFTSKSGLKPAPLGTVLKCPACVNRALIDELEIWHHWLEARRCESWLRRFRLGAIVLRIES